MSRRRLWIALALFCAPLALRAAAPAEEKLAGEDDKAVPTAVPTPMGDERGLISVTRSTQAASSFDLPAFVVTGGGERKGACELVKNGSFDLDMSYDVPTQAAQMAGTIKWLLSSGVKAGSVKGSEYTTLIPITKENADTQTACWNLSDLKK